MRKPSRTIGVGCLRLRPPKCQGKRVAESDLQIIPQPLASAEGYFLGVGSVVVVLRYAADFPTSHLPRRQVRYSAISSRLKKGLMNRVGSSAWSGLMTAPMERAQLVS